MEIEPTNNTNTPGPAAAATPGPAAVGGPWRERAMVRMAARASPYPSKGERIQFKDGEEWKSVVVTGRGGKASSKLHRDYFNVSDGEQGQGVYLDKVEWRPEEATNEADNTG